jgi:hypothetical protein
MLRASARRSQRTALPLLLALTAVLLAACGGSAEGPPTVGGDGVVVSTVESRPTAPADAGGKPAAPPPGATATSIPFTGGNTPGSRPTSGRWIEVDLTRFVVQLMDGNTVVKTIGPVAVGEQINTGQYLSTQTGLFQVYNKIEPLAYDAPYDTYISHWVGFDPAKDNGFHSFLKDQSGKVVDASTGKISNGCIRTGDAEAIYAYAEIGMPVYVHL